MEFKKYYFTQIMQIFLIPQIECPDYPHQRYLRLICENLREIKYLFIEIQFSLWVSFPEKSGQVVTIHFILCIFNV